MRPHRRIELLARCSPLLLLCIACGARTDLSIPNSDAVDASVDAAPRLDAGPRPIECEALPDGGVRIPLEMDAIHSTVDVALVLDATGSMLDEAVLLTSSASEVFTALTDLAPDVALGLGFSGDYADPPYGTATEHVAAVPIAIGADIERLPTYVMSVPMDWTGGDGPEAQSQALYLYATNDPFWDLQPVMCPLGHVGRMCFRPDAARLFLLLTDALFHEGRGGTNAYDRARIPEARSHDDVVTALSVADARVIGVFSGPPMYAVDLTNLVSDSGSVTVDGAAVVATIPRNGDGLERAAISVTDTFLTRVPFDVDVATDSPSTVTVRAQSAEPPGAAIVAGDRFQRVTPGTRLRFQFELRGRLPARLSLVFRADGREILVRRALRIEAGPTCFTDD